MIAQPDVAEVTAWAVEAFESAYVENPGVDPLAFAPMPSYPQHCSVVAELIRVDMELKRRRGRIMRIADYLPRCPGLVFQTDQFAKVAFEEYRQRRLSGEAVEPLEYHRQFGIDVSVWPPILPEQSRAR